MCTACTVSAVRDGRTACIVRCGRWLRPGLEDRIFTDSFCKLFALLSVCDELGVDVGAPVEACEGVVIVPLYSWHHYTFDVQDPR